MASSKKYKKSKRTIKVYECGLSKINVKEFKVLSTILIQPRQKSEPKLHVIRKMSKKSRVNMDLWS